MADPLTSTLRLTEPTIGGDTGLWAGYLNNNMIFTDEGVNQTITISIPDTNVTLVADGTTGDQARYYGYNFTGALTASRTVTLPNVQRQGWAANNTTGGFSVILTSGAGTNVTLPPDGLQRLYATDGSTNSSQPSVGFANVWQTIANFSLSGAASQTMSLPTVFRRFRLTLQGFTTSVSTSVFLQFSANGGSTYVTTTNNWISLTADTSSATPTIVNTGSAVGILLANPTFGGATAQGYDSTSDIYPGSASFWATVRTRGYGTSASGSAFNEIIVSGGIGTTGVMNFMKLIPNAGTLSGVVILEALP